jgi:hypothetical protein
MIEPTISLTTMTAIGLIEGYRQRRVSPLSAILAR